MITLRKAEDRFHTDAGWLDSWHTFSFGGHFDAKHAGFRSLLVINDDTVAPGMGFPQHGHRDMEIISYVVDGALAHEDSMGNGGVIRPGDVQRMSAGSGIRHSEMNAAADAPVHFLQIWITPDGKHEPGYAQIHVEDAAKRDTLKLVASGRATSKDAPVTVHADADLYASLLSAGARVEHALAAGRHAWIHVVKGAVRVNDAAMKTGDGAAVSDVAHVAIEATDASEILVFDLA